jgi:hypothetical protein
MQLSNKQFSLFDEFLRDVVTAFNHQQAFPEAHAAKISEILAEVQIGYWVIDATVDGGTSLSFRSEVFGYIQSLELIRAFASRDLPFLSVRRQSWEIYLNCEGTVLSEHCDEDLDSLSEATERLRVRCEERT